MKRAATVATRLLVLLLIVTGCSAAPAPVVGGLPVPGRPQEPRPPLPYRSEDVAYRNGEIDLAGTLTLPEGPGLFTALLLVTGGGPQDRDETLFGHKPFLVLADALTRAGYAVLRVDDRGVGGSSGDLTGADYDELAGDVVVGVDYLRSRPDVERVGLLGHSEGGYLAPLAAQRSADVAFVVSMAGPAVPFDQVWELQERWRLGAAGLPPDQVEVQVATVRELVGLLRAEDYTGASAAARQVLANEGVPLDQIAARLPDLTSRYFRALVLHDPAPSLDALAVPVLAFYGGKDLQVPADQSVPALRARLADNPDVTVVIFPELNHLMQPATSGAPAEYATIETTLAPDVLDLITRWLQQRYPAP